MKKRFCKLMGIIFCFGVFWYWQNNGIQITEYAYEEKVPEGFKGQRILQISDLQNKSFGKNHEILMKKLEGIKPDYIVITGDLVDRNRTDVEIVMEFIKQLKAVAPIYYVSGNHEHQSPKGTWEDLYKQLLENGVYVLENEKISIEKEGDILEWIGISDHSVNPNIEEVLKDLTTSNQEKFQILLSHRPELFEVYTETSVDLVFTGHAHGGQIRLPFLGGLYSPHQGFFPEYTEGLHQANETTMVVSRGLGNSTFPLRVNNRPELVVVTL